MKIGFLGCGAMGSIYAGNLTKAHEVYIFDAMPAVCEAVNTTGITIDEPDGSTRVYHPVIATTDPSTIGEMDIMIVFVKYLFLESALEKCKTMIGPHTIVLSLQNGIGNYDEIAKVVPEKQICCGTTAHGAHQPRPRPLPPHRRGPHQRGHHQGRPRERREGGRGPAGRRL